MKDYEAKDKVYIKEVYFDTANNPREDTLRFNRRYRYILKDVNRFIYKQTTAEQKGENLNAERPEILKAIKFPGFLSLNNITTKDVEIFTKNGDPCHCTTIEILIDSIKELKTPFEKLKAGALLFKTATDKFSTYAEINRELEKIKMKPNQTWPQALVAKQKSLREKLGISLQETDTDEKITTTYLALKTFSETTLESIGKEAGAMLKELNKIIDHLKLCLDLKNDLLCGKDTCSEIYKKGSRENKLMAECISKLQDFAGGITTSITEAKASIKAMQTALDEGKILAVQTNYNLLVHQNFELELDIFKADKDVHEITFTAATDAPLAFGNPMKYTVKVNAITSGGWKIDYSTGAFLSWGSNKFLGPEYFFEKPTDTTKIIREAERTKRGLLSVGALLHVSPRILWPVRPAFSAGVSTSAGFDVLNFHGGISLIIGRAGKPNRIILTYGITLREVDLLNNRYALDVERKDYPDAVPVSKNFPVRGSFFALTYNIKRINK
jgi:hypothetical protein